MIFYKFESLALILYCGILLINCEMISESPLIYDTLFVFNSNGLRLNELLLVFAKFPIIPLESMFFRLESVFWD